MNKLDLRERVEYLRGRIRAKMQKRGSMPPQNK